MYQSIDPYKMILIPNSSRKNFCKLNLNNCSFLFFRFVVCYIMNGEIAALGKKCPTNQYFPPGAKMCSTHKPDVCV